ncbi:MAG: DVU_1551 family NTP transferase [Thermodesulfobacteriota bacterium]
MSPNHPSNPAPAPEVAAIVLAAGRSGRMGRLKPLLPLGPQTVLARVVDTCRQAGLGTVLVVLGHHAAELAPAVAALGLQPVYNPQPERGMFSSLLAGVAALPPQARAFLVLPVDLPLVRVHTLRRLLEAWQEGRGPMLVPTFLGRRGHPPLLDAGLAPALAAWSGPNGLRGFLEQRAEVVEVPAADRFLRLDLDTPQDYQRLLRAAGRYDLPSTAECLALVQEVQGLGPELWAHCHLVARIALALGRGLRDRGGRKLEMRLIAAGGLLHDVGKGQPDHAAAGAALLRAMDWERVARVVAAHVDLAGDGQGPLDEAALVYLADKLVQADRPVTLEERFAASLARHGRDPQARQNVERRRQQARRLQERVEAALGQDLAGFLAAAGPALREARP